VHHINWQLYQKLASLDEEQLANSDETNPPSKQTELAMLEHEIAFITKGEHDIAARCFSADASSAELPTLDVPLNDFAISLKTREMLVSSIEQHEAGVHMKRSELERQRRLLHQDEETWRNLKDVRRGLEAKRARLIQKEEEAQDRGSALDALRQRVKAVEGSLARFLTLVIEICDSLYEDRDRSKSMQLKHLVDVSRSKPPLVTLS
jgi:DNA repair ATPase RecN